MKGAMMKGAGRYDVSNYYVSHLPFVYTSDTLSGAPFRLFALKIQFLISKTLIAEFQYNAFVET